MNMKNNMVELASVIEMRNFVESKGFTIIPISKPEGIKVIVFRGDKWMGEGKHIYKNKHVALETTEREFYNRFKNK